MKVRVKRIHGVATWSWGVKNEACCIICQNPFEACCPDCTIPGDNCPPVFGRCEHALHMHCLMKWLESQKEAQQKCPLCREEWKFREA